MERMKDNSTKNNAMRIFQIFERHTFLDSGNKINFK